MKWLLALFILVLLGISVYPDNKLNKFKLVTNKHGGSEVSIQEFNLPDGTRCAVATSGYGTGLTCDWN